MNEELNKIEEQIIRRNGTDNCEEPGDCDMPHTWIGPIEHILKRADQVWPTGTLNQKAIKTRDDFVTLLKQDRKPIPLSRIREFTEYYRNLGKFLRTFGKSSIFLMILRVL